MSLLLEEIKRKNEEAAQVLEDADLRTDFDIQSLTREDLNELFPGAKNLKLRRNIFDIIHKQKPIALLLKEMKAFIPEESLRAALSNNGVLVDYLRILKDLKSQMYNVQSFLDAHIGLLEGLRTSQPNPGSAPPGTVGVYSREPGKGFSDNIQRGGYGAKRSRSGESTSSSSGPVGSYSGQTDGRSQEQGTYADTGTLGASDHSRQTSGRGKQPKGEPFTLLSFSEVALLYQMVVAGQTFGAHLQLMAKVNDSVKNWVMLSEDSQDPKVTFVFCPISSRIASDVDAAMHDVKGDKPVILVLMHHSHEVKHTTSLRTWDEDGRVVLHVNVFYHETVRGLLKCEENNAAVSVIRGVLLEHFCQTSYNTSGNGVGVGAEGGKDRSSDTDSSSSGKKSNKWWHLS